MAPVLPRLAGLPILEQIPYLHFLLFLPAAIVGGLRYLAAPRTFRAVPMLAIIAVMVAGLVWVDATERGRGMVELALVATPLPLAVLIQRRREWLVGVIAYIVASTGAAIYLFYDWLGQAERTGLDTFRYGGLYDENVVRIMEPNITATHLGFGVLLTGILWLAPTPGAVERRWRVICTACLPVLLTGVVLSASRGGTLSLLGAVTVLAALTSLRRSWSPRTNVLGGFALVAIAALLLFAPNPVSNRIATEPGAAAVGNESGKAGKAGSGSVGGAVLDESTGSVGGRTATWRAAIEASGSSRSMTLAGAGTGGADHAIAAANPDLIIARVGEHDVIRANAHSTYFYWLVSFGIVGMLLAGGAVAVMALFALQNDWYRSYGAGVAMMAFFLLTSVTLIANRLEITSIAISAITLGYVLSRSDVGADVCGPRPVRPWRGRGGATCGW